MTSLLIQVTFMPGAYLTFSVETPLNAVVFGDAALPMATPLAMVMRSSAGMVRPSVADALMLPETPLMASEALVVGVARSGATVTSTLTVTGLASVMFAV